MNNETRPAWMSDKALLTEYRNLKMATRTLSEEERLELLENFFANRYACLAKSLNLK
jgi:hypothetical protein